jgi:hypothetical protein
LYDQATEKDDNTKKKSAASRTKSQVLISRKESALLIRVEIPLLVVAMAWCLTKLQKRMPLLVWIHVSAEDIRKKR